MENTENVTVALSEGIGRNAHIHALRPERDEHIRAISFGKATLRFSIAEDVVYVERFASGYRDLPKLRR